MKSKYDIIISIDPDTEKSGVCLLHQSDRRYHADKYTFPKLLDLLTAQRESQKQLYLNVVIVVESGWKNKISNYHTAADRKGQRISRNVGANHQVGKNIVEICKSIGLEVIEQKPLRKCWKGKNGKITIDEMNQILANLGMEQLKTKNQEILDATLLAINFSNLPIRLSTHKT